MEGLDRMLKRRPRDWSNWYYNCGGFALRTYEWVDVWDNSPAVRWWDKSGWGVWRELSIREAAKKYGVSIEDFLYKALVEGDEDYERGFSFRCIPMIEPYNKTA